MLHSWFTESADAGTDACTASRTDLNVQQVMQHDAHLYARDVVQRCKCQQQSVQSEQQQIRHGQESQWLKLCPQVIQPQVEAIV